MLLISGCGGSGSSSSTSSMAPTTRASHPVVTVTAPIPPITQTQTLSNLKQVGLALLEYVQDWDERYPLAQTTTALEPALYPYARTNSIYTDPNTGGLFQYNATLAGTVTSTYNMPSTYVTFYDLNPPLSDAQPVAFLDGHVALVTEAQWTQYKLSSNIP